MAPRKRKNVQEMAPSQAVQVDFVVGDRAVEIVDIPTADVVTVRGPIDEVGGSYYALATSFVKLAPVLKAEERAGYDQEAARREVMNRGARAVVVAPTFEAAEKGAAPQRSGGRVDPREELRAWFLVRDDGEGDAAAALDACLRIADEVGL